MSEYSLGARGSCLRRLIGQRGNLFRAMHDRRFYIADDQSVLAARCGDFALTACITYDPVFCYFYVRDCGWYGSDLSRLYDEDVPEAAQQELLRTLAVILG